MNTKIINALPDATVIGSIVLSFVLGRTFPLIEVIPAPANLIGWLIVVVGAIFAVRTLAMLKSNQGSTDVMGSSSALSMEGPYRYSRNPFYIWYVVITIGAAVILGSITAFVGPIACLAILNFIVIPLEEKKLRALFGQKYLRYMQVTRRWI